MKNTEQQNKVKEYLNDHIATAAMISEALGIPHKNICRYKRRLENSGLIKEYQLGICKVTGYKAWYLSKDY